MKWSTKVSDGNRENWVITFGLIFRRRSHTCTVEARNVRTGERLKMPQDRMRLTELLPWDDWPPFATMKYNNPTHPIQTERLI
jgi:hypothetical protein